MWGMLCFELHELFPGGNVYLPTDPDVPPRWTTVGKKCKPFLQSIVPYLRHKKRQAEIGLAFIETIGIAGGDSASKDPKTKLIKRELQALLKQDKDAIQERSRTSL
jgi:hypothetical protein